MLDVAVLDCCGPDDSAATRKYVDFLRRKFPERISVNFYDIDKDVPPALYEKLRDQGANAVPILVIDGKIIAMGELPDWMESLTLIESHLEPS
jgi:hypothetical protein